MDLNPSEFEHWGIFFGFQGVVSCGFSSNCCSGRAVVSRLCGVGVAMVETQMDSDLSCALENCEKFGILEQTQTHYRHLSKGCAQALNS